VSYLAKDCARARESFSVQLDGELPTLELDRLETHLRICPACSAWAEEVRDVTLQLREAALEMPAERFVLPRRSRRWAVSSGVALVSAAAVVATMFVAPGRQQASFGALHQVVLHAPTGQRMAVPRLLRLADGLSAASFSDPQPASAGADRVAS
jgi:predicted anti-sigma-YlaC factor YlaD